MNEHTGKIIDESPSRRGFLKAGALSSAALLSGAALDRLRCNADDRNPVSSDKLKIRIAGYKYDRVEALIDGRVQVVGCETQFEVSSIGDMNTHVFSGPQTREVTEIGLLPYVLAFANDGFRDYTLIPVFPLRLFRHKSIFIRTDCGITKPEDLRGRKVATAGYSSTSLTWIRGIMQHQYGVRPEDIQWVISSKDSSANVAGKMSQQEQVIPKGIPIQTGPEGKDESALLVDGDVDAIFHAAEPRAYVDGHPKVGRLFPDYRKTERAYFAETGIFPIMHAVAVRKDVIRANPWLPKAVFNAYSQAKQLNCDFMKNAAWYKGSLPWFGQEFEETRKLMGDNYWSYSIDRNLKTLDALLQYSHEQGLARRKLNIEEIFHPSTLELKEAIT
jgi:4,5-dihydroxyphthalate decarboxylase